MQLLTEQGLDFTTIEYLKEPPTAAELDALCTIMAVEPKAIVRTKETRFQELGLSVDDDRSRADWLRVLTENPVLIERPIVVIEDRAVIGRPPENIHTIL